MKFLVLNTIQLYQKIISPLLPRACRFYPSCSAYTCEAVEKWGIRRGILLGVKRLLRCHPWNPGGFDLVP